MTERVIKDESKLSDMERMLLDPCKVMEKIALFMGDEYKLISDKNGYRILRKAEENGDAITGQVVFCNLNLDKYERLHLHVFKPDPTEKIERFFSKERIRFCTSRYYDCSSIMIPGFFYDDPLKKAVRRTNISIFGPQFENILCQKLDGLLPKYLTYDQVSSELLIGLVDQLMEEPMFNEVLRSYQLRDPLTAKYPPICNRALDIYLAHSK